MENREKPFKGIVVRCKTNNPTTAYFSVDDEIDRWVNPFDDTLAWHEFQVCGLPPLSDSDMDDEFENDFPSAVEIGTIFGCHIAKSLIVNLEGSPYAVCDSDCADLEAMFSALQEHEDEFIIDVTDDIFYIHEIELKTEYQGFGYESVLLRQLPAIIVKTLHVFPYLLMYFPRQVKYDEPEQNEEMDAIIRHRQNYQWRAFNKAKEDDNVVLFPPMHDIPEAEVNRLLGRRNPGNTVPESYRNRDTYKLYKSVGFKEIGKTGWLCKRVSSVFS